VVVRGRAEPIGRVLPSAPSTYYEHEVRRANPDVLPSSAWWACRVLARS